MPLPELVQRLRSSGVDRKDVDALLAGIARPLAEGEKRRTRADFLTSLLKSRHLRSMKGSSGVSIESAAMEALSELGDRYSQQIPPEILGGQRKLPGEGIFLTIVLTGFCVVIGGGMGLLAALPVLVVLLGGALEIRALQMFGLVIMWLMALGLLAIGGFAILEDSLSSSDKFDGLGIYLGAAALAASAVLALLAVLLRRPAWRTPVRRPGG